MNSFQLALKKYMQSIGVRTVQKTLLNGIKKVGEEMNYQLATFLLEPTDFAAYLLRFD